MDTGFVVFTLCIGLLMLVALGFLFSGARGAVLSIRAKSWLTAQGKIEACCLDNWQDGDTDMYRIHVRYAYTVQGQQYTNQTLAFGYDGSSDFETQEQIFNKLVAANRVDVRYHPADPQTASLTYGIPNPLRKRIVDGLLGLVLCFGFYAAVLSIMYGAKVFPQQF